MLGYTEDHSRHPHLPHIKQTEVLTDTHVLAIYPTVQSTEEASVLISSQLLRYHFPRILFCSGKSVVLILPDTRGSPESESAA